MPPCHVINSITKYPYRKGQGAWGAQSGFDGVVWLRRGSPVSDDILAIGSYTTTEVATGFKWINGKPIYKKTVDVGAMPNNTTKSVAHGVTGIELVIRIEGNAANGSGAFLNLSFSNGIAPTSSVGVLVNGANIQLICGANQSSFSGHATLYYTKA